MIFCWKNQQHGRQSIHLNPLPADILPYLTCIFVNQALLEPYGKANHVMILKKIPIRLRLSRKHKILPFPNFFCGLKVLSGLNTSKSACISVHFLKKENRKIFFYLSLGPFSIITMTPLCQKPYPGIDFLGTIKSTTANCTLVIIMSHDSWL